MDVKIEDNQDSLMVTTENRNLIIHVIVNHLKKDETYKIEASKTLNTFCICLIYRHALISVTNGEIWKHVKKYIDKPRPDKQSCADCYEPQHRNFMNVVSASLLLVLSVLQQV